MGVACEATAPSAQTWRKHSLRRRKRRRMRRRRRKGATRKRRRRKRRGLKRRSIALIGILLVFLDLPQNSHETQSPDKRFSSPTTLSFASPPSPATPCNRSPL